MSPELFSHPQVGCTSFVRPITTILRRATSLIWGVMLQNLYVTTVVRLVTTLVLPVTTLGPATTRE